jgi:nitrogen fixation/metabolism regulation signal transduction histidine kinase
MPSVTLATRIRISLLLTISMVLLIGFLSFFYLNSLNDKVNAVLTKDLRLARLAEEIKTTTFDLHRKERAFFAQPTEATHYSIIKNKGTHLADLITEAAKSANKAENQARLKDMQIAVDDYVRLAEEVHTIPYREELQDTMRDNLLKLNALNRLILQDRYKELETHQMEIDRLASDAQRNMIIVIIIMLVFVLALGLVAPNLVSAPFRRIYRAIEEIRSGNLNVTIPVTATDELGELSQRLNDALVDLRRFDDMKIKRIAFERRRMETLANMVDYGVVLLSAEGKIEFVNSQLYILFHLQTADLVGREAARAPLPQGIRNLLVECVEQKEKFDNRECSVEVSAAAGEPARHLALLADLAVVRRHDGTIANVIVTFEERREDGERMHLRRHWGRAQEQS